MEATEKRKIGKYEITGTLGRGGMGVVYRAEDKRIGRKVAIKTLIGDFANQPEMLERFYREAQAGILQHPNIVIVYDLGDEDGAPFIVMEFVEGEPLDKIVNSGRQLPLIDKLSIIEQVCLGLGFAHRRGVVHRDIKPANVIVQPDGHAKIVDFGIARVQGSGVEGSLTRTGNVIGTIYYIAPERLKGQPFDGRSDIFAAGIMLYQLLAGQLPFSGEDMTVLQKLVNEQHPPLSQFLQNYPPQLDAILDRALAKDPEQRYATADEFAADLHGLAEELKKGQIVELFSDAQRLAEEQQFGRAREVLLQLVRIDPQHTSARQLLGVVQQNLARMQRAEQVRQLIAESDEAIAASRFPEALNAVEQAVRLDPENEELKTRLEQARQKKQRFDEINTLMSQADFMGQRGDWTGAANVIEKALKLDQADTRIRALYTEYSRQAKIAAQQGQIRELLGRARHELSSRHYTAAIDILREVGKIDPAQAEMESMLQAAVSGQEQERRRKLLEQIQAEIENAVVAEDFDRATNLAERAVQQLPNETSLQQLMTRVALQAKKHRERQLIATTVARAQELFLQSPAEALLIVQKALQELPGEERLLTLEDSLRQRLKAAEIEEVRGRYLREAQDAMGRSQFDRAVEILESYQLEFNDTAGVSDLLELARNELAQQQRRARIANAVAKARALMAEEQFDEAIRLIEPAAAETSDPALSRLLDEAREQRAESERKAGAFLTRVARLRERGQLDEAIEALQAYPASAIAGSQANALLNEIRSEQARKQATSKALAAATQSIEQGNFQSAIESLEAVQRAYGESADIARAIAEIEARRRQLANEAAARAIEAARSALAANNADQAIKELKGVAEQAAFADEAQKSDLQRLAAEARKPRKTGTVARIDLDTGIEAAPKRNLMLPLVGGGVLVAALAVGAYFVFRPAPAVVTPPPPTPGAGTTPSAAEAPKPEAPKGTLIVKGNTDNVTVFVDGTNQGFTEKDGSAKIPLSPGRHTIRFTKPGFIDYSPPPVTIAANAQAPVSFTLNPTGKPPEPIAYVTVQTTPGASVSIDGAVQGQANDSGSFNTSLKPGSHNLDLALDGYFPSRTQPFTVTQGERQNFNIALTAKPKLQPPTASLIASSRTIQAGEAVTLSWQTNNASSVTIDQGIGAVDKNGTRDVRPTGNITYVLTAKGDGGTQSATVDITVKAAPPPVETKTAPAETPKPTPVDEGPQIVAALNRYKAAWNAHDIVGVQAAWPTIKPEFAKAYATIFKDKSFRSTQISDSCSPATPSVAAGSSSFIWSCTETTTTAGQSPHSANFHFSFTKKSGAWVIADRY